MSEVKEKKVIEATAYGLLTNGVYYTTKEKEDLINKGYTFEYYDTINEREDAYKTHKEEGHMVRRCFERVSRGQYSFYLAVKLRNIKVVKPVTKALTLLEWAVSTSIKYFKEEIETYIAQEQGDAEYFKDYGNYVDHAARGDYRVVKKDLFSILAYINTEEKLGYEFDKDMVMEGVAYAKWFKEVKEGVWGK